MVEVRGHIETRSRSALLNLYQEGTEWDVGETVEDGEVWLNYTLDEFPSAITNLSLQACDSNNLQACELQHYELDISPAFTINATSTCQTPDINQTSAEEQTVVLCEVVNLGLTEITVQYMRQSIQHQFNQTVMWRNRHRFRRSGSRRVRCQPQH